MAPQLKTADADVNRFAQQLEHAEFIDAAPELQPPHFGWLPPSGPFHPLVSDYRAALRALPRTGPDLTKHLHKQRSELQHLYDHCKAERAARHAGRVNDMFQGGLRRLIDADVRCDFALEDLRAVEAAIAKQNKARRKVKWLERMRPEFVTIGGELYPVSK